MPTARLMYCLMWLLTAGFIIHVVYGNFFHDPQAAEFLSHKIQLKRPVNTPVWLTVMNVHVIFACLAMASGALNFSTRMLKKYRKYHRLNGYVYLASILLVDITSGYMAPYATGGKINSIAFNMLNIVWLAMTVTAIVQIKKKQVDKHRKWMIRSYAFCFTNLLIHLITFIFNKGLGMAYSVSYTIGVYGAILLLPALAELVIRIALRSQSIERS